MPKISPLASVDKDARLAEDVEVGPFCVVGPHVILGAGCKLLSHVSITGHTTVGRDNAFHPNCVIGGTPQDLKYAGGPTRLEIGDGNVIREAVTIHIGTEAGGGVTRVGNQNLFMVNSHVGHDGNIGSHCIIANNVMLAGHVAIGDNVAIMGGVGIHHFVTVGEFAYLAGLAQITHDVPPYVKVSDCDQVRGLNTIGLKRAGFSADDIEELEITTRRLFMGREKPFAVVLGEFDTLNGINPRVKRMVEFLRQRNIGRHGRYLEAKRQA
ncbi:MAG TPA: acyl-ACP--UDP-N-acetylglucosamine O-acyltransferase [Tepidisphaeraceae bacterium]|jgi:UDP-N-acetylglucosamine acyltransferase|nr:acyl-ACP--UDP-N-acetylglucosamine O-acyltransferase [Tepidisphaeraceae bacterium]